jgi:CheY-like chemotaxis protein
MPKRSGHEAAKAIRRSPHGGAVTLVAITGWDQDRDKDLTRDAGFDRHMTKPVDPRQLAQYLSSGTAATRATDRRQSAG